MKLGIIKIIVLALVAGGASSGQSGAENSNKRASVGYVKIAGGKYKLTRNMTFRTKRFGTVVLTKGFESDGSSSPIADSHESRIAGFLHDALYSVSSHLRLTSRYRRNWTRKEADDEYCEHLGKLGVSSFHRSFNCRGVRYFPGIARAWDRLARKRQRRWRKRARQHRKLLRN